MKIAYRKYVVRYAQVRGQNRNPPLSHRGQRTHIRFSVPLFYSHQELQASCRSVPNEYRTAKFGKSASDLSSKRKNCSQHGKNGYRTQFKTTTDGVGIAYRNDFHVVLHTWELCGDRSKAVVDWSCLCLTGPIVR